MNQQQQIQYLANIYFLARSDKDFNANEDSLLIQIAESIGGGYLETRKALDISMEADFKIKLPKLAEDRISNLENLMVIAFSDSKLHKMEKNIIMSFAKALNIDKKQLAEIKKRAIGKVKTMMS